MLVRTHITICKIIREGHNCLSSHSTIYYTDHCRENVALLEPGKCGKMPLCQLFPNFRRKPLKPEVMATTLLFERTCDKRLSLITPHAQLNL